MKSVTKIQYFLYLIRNIAIATDTINTIYKICQVNIINSSHSKGLKVVRGIQIIKIMI